MQLFAAVDDQHYLLPGGANGVADGGALTVEVTRESIPGAEPWKRPLARVVHDSTGSSAPTGRELSLTVRNELDEAGWDDLVEEARSGTVRFAEGELRIFPTPAMTLIDVDGHLPVEALAMVGAEAAARAILRHGIGGSIGIDLPTISGRAQRQAIGSAVDAVMPQPFERTAVNGFGFMQIVRRRERPSLIEQVRLDPAATDAALLLRQAERAVGTGDLTLTARGAVIERIAAHSAWVETLQNRTGRAVRLIADAAVKGAGHAQ